MPRVLCTLPNASALINGVAFVADRGQMISEEVSEEVAAGFSAIPGYEVLRAPSPASAAAPVADAVKGRGSSARAAKETAPSTDAPAAEGEDAAKATETSAAAQDGPAGALPGV